MPCRTVAVLIVPMAILPKKGFGTRLFNWEPRERYCGKVALRL